VTRLRAERKTAHGQTDLSRASARTFFEQMCDTRAMTHSRLHLDQITAWAEEPILRARAVPTGLHSTRIITVAPLSLVVMTVVDSYAPMATTAYRTADEAAAAAERVMAEPDSRGVLRDWVLGDPSSGETLWPGRLGPR
jgi:hypothetical protein